MKIAIFASGNGSNFQALVESKRKNNLDYDVVCLIVDQENIGAIVRAKKLGIPCVYFSPNHYVSKQAYEETILDYLKAKKINLIVLAGYMRIVGNTLLHAYPNFIINIHPSLLPQFPGRHGIEDAYNAHVRETGVTVHYVDEEIDTGTIIVQEIVPINENESLELLEERIHQVEHILYPKVIQQLAEASKEE